MDYFFYVCNMLELKILLNIELGTNKGKRYKVLFLPRMVRV